jgi:hypothetical protein
MKPLRKRFAESLPPMIFHPEMPRVDAGARQILDTFTEASG